METSYTIEDKELLQKVGERIRHFRIEVGLSQEKLSFECNLDRTYIGSVERGERKYCNYQSKQISESTQCFYFRIVRNRSVNKEFKIPPKSSKDLSAPEELAKKLSCLVGTEFKLTGKTRTDGSNVRKLVASYT